MEVIKYAFINENFKIDIIQFESNSIIKVIYEYLSTINQYLLFLINCNITVDLLKINFDNLFVISFITTSTKNKYILSQYNYNIYTNTIDIIKINNNMVSIKNKSNETNDYFKNIMTEIQNNLLKITKNNIEVSNGNLLKIEKNNNEIENIIYKKNNTEVNNRNLLKIEKNKNEIENIIYKKNNTEVNNENLFKIKKNNYNKTGINNILNQEESSILEINNDINLDLIKKLENDLLDKKIKELEKISKIHEEMNELNEEIIDINLVLSEKKQNELKKKEIDEERNRIFEVEKNTYNQIKNTNETNETNIQGNARPLVEAPSGQVQVTEENIVSPIFHIPKFFFKKFIIYKFLDNKGLLNVDNCVELFILLYNEYDSNEKDNENYVPNKIFYLRDNEDINKYKNLYIQYKELIYEFMEFIKNENKINIPTSNVPVDTSENKINIPTSNVPVDTNENNELIDIIKNVFTKNIKYI